MKTALTQYSPSRSLMSSNQCLLVVTRSIQKTYGHTALAVAGPRLSVECSGYSYETTWYFISYF